MSFRRAIRWRLSKAAGERSLFFAVRKRVEMNIRSPVAARDAPAHKREERLTKMHRNSRAPQSRHTLRDSGTHVHLETSPSFSEAITMPLAHLRPLTLGPEILSHLRFCYKPVIQIVTVLPSTQFVHFVRSLANPLLNLVWRLNRLGFCKRTGLRFLHSGISPWCSYS
jgi:hypothetical protein